MSSESGGDGAAGVFSTGAATPSYAEVANAAKRRQVARDKDFVLTCDQSVPISTVVDAVIASVNPPQDLNSVQQINDKKFIISFKSNAAAAAYNLQCAASLRIPGATSVCKWLGADVRRIRVTYLPTAIENTKLEEVLSEYGRVLRTTDEVYAGKPVLVKTGTRLVDLEMTRPVPNLITVCGYTVPTAYKGVVVQCRRCLLEGHLKAACVTPFCTRCKSFGHEEAACEAPLLHFDSVVQGANGRKIRNEVAASGGDNQSGHNNDSASEVASPVALSQGAANGEPTVPVTEGPELSQQNIVEKRTGVDGGDQKSGDPPVSNMLINLGNLMGSDSRSPPVGVQRATTETGNARLQATAAVRGRPGEGKPVHLNSSDSNPTGSNDVAASSRNLGWQGVQTRSSKRRQSSLTASSFPVAKRPSGEP